MRRERSAISPDVMGSKPIVHPGRFLKRGIVARKLSANRSLRDIGAASLACRMGGAERYPSIAICGDDGFREGLNPSLSYVGGVHLPVESKCFDRKKPPVFQSASKAGRAIR